MEQVSDYFFGAQTGTSAVAIRADPPSHVMDSWLSFVKNVLDALEAPTPLLALSRLEVFGRLGSQLALHLLHFCVPDGALDPLTASRAAQAYQASTKEIASIEAASIEDWESRTLQRNPSPLDTLKPAPADAFFDATGDTAAIAHHLPARSSNLPRVAALWHDFNAFARDVLPQDRVLKLAHAMERRAGSTERLLAEQDVLQQSIISFSSQWTARFSDLEDLIRPALVGLEVLSVSLEALRAHCEIDEHNAASRFVKASVLGSSLISALEVNRATPAGAIKTHRHVQEHVLRIAAIAALPTLVHLNAATAMHQDIAALAGLAMDEVNKAKEKAAAEASIYKSKVTNVSSLTDAEWEENDFLALFPDFSNYVQDAGKESSGSKPLLLAEHLSSLLDAFIAVSIGGPGQQAFDQARNAFVMRWFHTDVERMHCRVDASSAHRTLLRLALRDGVETNAKGFYKSSNVEESLHAHRIVADLVTRLRALKAEWPDQEVLVQLLDRCDTIQSMHSASPVPRLLSAFEQLLAHTDDWEGFASSQTTLTRHRDQITAKIIDWRRMELHSWQSLLDHERERLASECSSHFLPLYQAAISASAFSDGAAALSKHHSELSVSLDAFLRSSPLGQFSRRLCLVQSLSVHSLQLSKASTGMSRIALAETAALLGSVAAFFRQFEVDIDAHLAREREKLDKQISEFVQLASWKDTNVHALRTSAAKTHRRLHKTIQSYRRLLQGSADPLLAQSPTLLKQQADVHVHDWEEERKSAVGQGTASMLVQSLPASETTPHLQDLPRTLGALRSMLDTLLAAASSNEVSALLYLSENAAETAADLRKRTPATMTTANEKAVKNLQAEKQRALTSGLKSLREQGLSTSYRPDFSTSFILLLPCLETAPLLCLLDKEHVTAADLLTAKMAGILPMLRAALPNRSADIAPEALLRAHAAVENLATAALADRKQLLEFASKFDDLFALSARLDKIPADEQPFLLPQSSQQTIAMVRDSVTVLTTSLEQLVQEFPTLSQALGVSPVTQAGLNDLIHALSQGARAELDNLTRLTESHRPGTGMIATGSELEEIGDVLDRVKALEARSRQLAVKAPFIQSFLQPVLAEVEVQTSAIEDLTAALNHKGDANRSEEIDSATGTFITSVLLASQRLRKLELASDVQATPAALGRHHRLRAKDALLSIDLAACFSVVGRTSQNVAPLPSHWRTILPFVSVVKSLAAVHIRSSLAQHAAELSLAHGLAKIVLPLTQQGFCRPEQVDENDQGQDNEENEEQLEGGTGLGDGSGAKDISDQLRDDEEIEELQQDGSNEEKDGEDQTEAANDAREAGDDFMGKLDSIDAGGDGDEDGDDASDDNDDFDDAIDEIDKDEDEQIDEQLWNGEHEKETQEQKGEGKEEGGEDAAREDSREDQQPQADGKESDSKEEDQSDDKDGEDQQRDDKDEEMEDGDSDEGEGDAKIAEPDRQGEEEQHAEDIKPLDDPDNEINLDDDKLDEEADNADSEDEQPPNGEGALEGQEPPNEIEVDAINDDEEQEQPADGDQPDADDDGHDQEMADPGDQAEKGDDEAGDDARVADDAPGEGDGSAMADGAAQSQSAAPDEAQGSDEAADKTATKQDRSQEAASIEEEKDAAPEGEATMPSNSSAAQQTNAAQGASSGPQQGQTEEAEGAESSAETSDPAKRSFGDALAEFRRDLQRILDEESGEGPEDGPSEQHSGADGDVEHVGEDQDTDMQAVGSTLDNEASNLQGLQGAEDDDDTVAPNQGADVNIAPDAAIEQAWADTEQPNVENEKSNDLKGGSASAADSASEAKKSQSQLNGNAAHDLDRNDGAEMDRDAEDEVDLEAQLAEYRAAGDQTMARASELWQSYQSRVSELSFQLCEQLRLTLVPTLANRLRGDYRTGKRLNMRQIIPFIASDFVKDKIWLRRTKPSARQYQVLLCIDDTKSMSHSRVAHLAVQTIALLTSALTKLEVGDIAVCKFGRDFDILHPFGLRTFSQTHGADVLSRLTFAQRTTNVLNLTRSSLRYLEQAKASQPSSSAELWQLQIVISDGMCEVSLLHPREKATLMSNVLLTSIAVYRITTVSAHCSVKPPSRASWWCSSCSTLSTKSAPRPPATTTVRKAAPARNPRRPARRS